jgi:hypothetical protein
MLNEELVCPIKTHKDSPILFDKWGHTYLQKRDFGDLYTRGNHHYITYSVLKYISKFRLSMHDQSESLKKVFLLWIYPPTNRH